LTRCPNSSTWLRPVPVALTVSALTLIHYAYMMSVPHEAVICFVPDDAFYGFQVARHFMATGVWSFDGGFTTTTGFHLLNVYLMSLFPGLLARPWVAIRVLMGFGAAVSIVSIFLICRLADRTFGPCALIPAFLLLTAASFTQQSVALMEYPYVIIIAALYVLALLSKRDRGWITAAAIFGLGTLGSLARGDFGGLPLAVVIASVFWYLRERRTRYLSRALLGLSGAAMGLALVTLHNLHFGGHLLSGSERAKALWGERWGYSLNLPVNVAVQTMISWSPAAVAIASLIACVLSVRIVAGLCKRWPIAARLSAAFEIDAQPATTDGSFAASAGVIAVMIYLLVYGADSAVREWYAASFVIPLLLLLGAGFHAISRDPIWRTVASAAVAIIATQNIACSYFPIWNSGKYFLAMAQYLRNHPPDDRIAGWNVGTVGYFLDGKITNLDGLMNDQIYPYMKAKTVNQYLDRAAIKYVVDFPVQIDNPGPAATHGYDGLALARRLKPIYTVRSRERDDIWLDYTFFALCPPQPGFPSNVTVRRRGCKPGAAAEKRRAIPAN
jgi:hypothetical protein